MYLVIYTKKFHKKFTKVDVRYRENISNRIDKLSENPHPANSKKLTNVENAYRLRVGDYRVIYKIYNDKLVVLAVDIDHRSRIYESL
jgi:mRNA interferase RelE/StbE